MLQSKLFSSIQKDYPSDEVSINAKLLLRSGFISKEVAGVFTYLPLGLRVLNKIISIVREEMEAVGAQEILMPALQNKENWEVTGRYNSFDALIKVLSKYGQEYALGPTHEEVVTPVVKKYIFSYKNLPLAVFQIQTKFRDEPRAKSGLLRGKEFLMKDLYSFHTDQKDFEKFYERMKAAYKSVYERCELKALEVEASGGAFSKASIEYQVLAPDGEDTIYYCPNGDFAQNKEVADRKNGATCPHCSSIIEEGRAIEVGNIFPLGTRFSEPFGLKYRTSQGKEDSVIMGCFGIGISRLFGTIVEIHNDDNGILWPTEVAPFSVHILQIGEESETKQTSHDIYKALLGLGVEVLIDDREERSAGEKFNDADFIGIPTRVVVSTRSLSEGSVEVKERGNSKSELIKKDTFLKRYVQ